MRFNCSIHEHKFECFTRNSNAFNNRFEVEATATYLGPKVEPRIYGQKCTSVHFLNEHTTCKVCQGWAL
jgi:hypothetical protein